MPVKAKKKKIKKQLRLKGINGKVKPSPQDLLIAKNLAEGKKKGEALKLAGVSPASARSNSAEILARPGVRAALAMTLEDAGITTKRIAECLNEGLSATKIISANLLVLNAGEEKEMPCVNGFIDATAKESEDEGSEKTLIRVEDFAVRHKYLETSCKLLDLFPREGSVVTEERVTVTEERNLIDQAEGEAGKRDISRYMVRREQKQI
jgi:hypothetical protein